VHPIQWQKADGNGATRACEQVVDHCVPGGHAVQFYEADEAVLVTNVGHYLAGGLSTSESVLVITTPAHQAAFTAYLEHAGGHPAVALAEGRLTFLDADVTLSRFMVNGYPDGERFDDVVGRLVRGLRKRATTGLRAYGEMVGLLWARGEERAAIRLEQLWHQLMKSVDFSLFCAYPIDIFGEQFESGLIDALLCAHTHLLSAVPNNDLERAVTRAMREVLYPSLTELCAEVFDRRPLWPTLPRGEGIALWLRSNVPELANEVLARARGYYDAGRAAPSESVA
jgi:hypothetical protein